MSKIDEGHPVWEAIDRGGGQTCDIRGVLRELDRAGFSIVPKEPTQKMMDAAFEDYHSCEINQRPWNGRTMFHAMLRAVR